MTPHRPSLAAKAKHVREGDHPPDGRWRQVVERPLQLLQRLHLVPHRVLPQTGCARPALAEGARLPVPLCDDPPLLALYVGGPIRAVRLTPPGQKSRQNRGRSLDKPDRLRRCVCLTRLSKTCSNGRRNEPPPRTSQSTVKKTTMTISTATRRPIAFPIHSYSPSPPSRPLRLAPWWPPCATPFAAATRSSRGLSRTAAAASKTVGALPHARPPRAHTPLP